MNKSSKTTKPSTLCLEMLTFIFVLLGFFLIYVTQKVHEVPVV